MSGIRGIMIYTFTQVSKLIGKNSKKNDTIKYELVSNLTRKEKIREGRCNVAFLGSRKGGNGLGK